MIGFPGSDGLSANDGQDRRDSIQTHKETL